MLLRNAIFLLINALRSCHGQNLKFRIWGGNQIPIEKVPYQISLQGNGRTLCGGTIISNDVILTAAHCVSTLLAYKDLYDNAKLTVHAGTASNKGGGAVVEIRDMVTHPEYNVTSWSDKDLALIWLAKPLIYSKSIKPIEMAAPGEVVPPGTMALVTGWGISEGNEENGGFPEMLRALEVPIMSSEECRATYKYSIKITSNMLCAGYQTQEGGKDTCEADSGGGLVTKGKLIGVVSFGPKECGKSEFPGVYVNVAALRSWIDDSLHNRAMASRSMEKLEKLISAEIPAHS